MIQVLSKMTSPQQDMRYGEDWIHLPFFESWWAWSNSVYSLSLLVSFIKSILSRL